MKKELWLPGLVFLAASIPMVYFLQYMKWGGDFVLLIAMGAGIIASAFAKTHLNKEQLAKNQEQTNTPKNR